MLSPSPLGSTQSVASSASATFPPLGRSICLFHFVALRYSFPSPVRRTSPPVSSAISASGLGSVRVSDPPFPISRTPPSPTVAGKPPGCSTAHASLTVAVWPAFSLRIVSDLSAGGGAPTFSV